MVVKIVVTGASGLVGHRLVRQLLERGGCEIVGLVRDVPKAKRVTRELAGDEIPLIEADVSDASSLEGKLDGFELLFHAAGLPEQWQPDSDTFHRINAEGTANVMREAVKAGVDRVVYTSTMDIFAAPEGGTLREDRLDAEDRPSAYGRSKQAADRAAREVGAEGLDVVHVCPSGVYGPSPNHKTLNSFFIKLLKGETPLLPPGGTSVVFVDALARLQLAAADRGQAGRHYLASDTYVDNRELATAIRNAEGKGKGVPPTAPDWLMTGVAAASELVARCFGTEPFLIRSQLEFLRWQARADATRAIDELGFEPTPLDEGVAATVAFLKEHQWV